MLPRDQGQVSLPEAKEPHRELSHACQGCFRKASPQPICHRCRNMPNRGWSNLDPYDPAKFRFKRNYTGSCFIYSHLAYVLQGNVKVCDHLKNDDRICTGITAYLFILDLIHSNSFHAILFSAIGYAFLYQCHLRRSSLLLDSAFVSHVAWEYLLSTHMFKIALLVGLASWFHKLIPLPGMWAFGSSLCSGCFPSYPALYLKHPRAVQVLGTLHLNGKP